jgi:hypothetical protein
MKDKTAEDMTEYLRPTETIDSDSIKIIRLLKKPDGGLFL